MPHVDDTHSVGPDEPEGADADSTGQGGLGSAKADEEDGLPAVPPLELPKTKAAPVAVNAEVNGLPAVTPPEFPASKAVAVASDQAVNGSLPLEGVCVLDWEALAGGR